ncbi:MAG: J domain-containing protein [Desulfovibrionales bacterium]
MTPEQSYAILRLQPGADLEQVKSSYRRLAFRYHPDLNPEDKNSSRKFQELNEAFVFLRNHLENPQHAGETYRTPPKGKDRPKAERSPGEGPQGRTRRAQFFFRKEEVLKDILKDPFARQVFEDIYSEIRRSRPGAGPRKRSAAVTREKHLHLDLGKRRIHLDMSQGITAGIKTWLIRQMDDEQVVYLPQVKLLPGTSIRIQVKHRWAGPAKTVDLTIPTDYVPGRPIRLQGLGKRIGTWRGDLYIRLLPK